MLSLAKHNNTSIGLIGHTVVNYPSAALAREAIKVMVDEGVSLIELQIPFSDPVADGPVFLKANYEALAQGVNLAQCFELMHEVSSKYTIPFVFMSYGNILYKKGFENFVVTAKQAGAQGVIVPDLPADISPDYINAAKKHDFAAIQLIPPNISETRLAELAKIAQGFIYAVARAGVTGAKTDFNNQLTDFVQKIHHYTDLPVAMGFGVASPDDVKALMPIADYAIIGTQALRVLNQQGIAGLQKFWHEIYEAAN